MSWWISLNDPVTDAPMEVNDPHQMQGGTFAVGGTNELALNVTYNYGKHFDFNQLNGLTGQESAQLLHATASTLQDNAHPDYWKPTEGNVKQTLLKLAAMAKTRPDGVWHVN